MRKIRSKLYCYPGRGIEAGAQCRIQVSIEWIEVLVGRAGRAGCCAAGELNGRRAGRVNVGIDAGASRRQ